jgi:hypothetical protein
LAGRYHKMRRLPAGLLVLGDAAIRERRGAVRFKMYDADLASLTPTERDVVQLVTEASVDTAAPSAHADSKSFTPMASRNAATAAW